MGKRRTLAGRALAHGTAWSVAAAVALTGLAIAPAQGADPGSGTDDGGAAGLLVRYPLDETSGTSAANTAPGSAVGPATVVGAPEWTGADGLRLDGVDDHVQLPSNLLAGLDSITVALDVRIDSTQATPYFIYGLGNVSGSSGNGYLFTTGDAYRTAIAPGDYTTERNTSKGSNLARGVWKHLTYTLTGTTGTLYEDGVQVARTTDVSVTPAQIGDGTTLVGYIGRSLYAGDRYLKGNVRDFRIYDRALSTQEVRELGMDSTTVAGAALDALKVPAIVDQASSTVTLPVVPGTDLGALAPVLDVAPQSQVTPANGSVQDLTTPVTYTIEGADGARRAWTVRARVMNSPLLPGYYADPNIAVFDGVYYLYATTDGTAGWGGKDFYVWKSTNLVDWERSAQPILTLDGARGNVPWATGNAWAPTIIERDGTYYFYFSGHNPTYDRKTIGVAVAKSPEGPFVAQPTAMITNAEAITSGQAIDPAAFKDPVTGKHFLFWGNGWPVVAELSDDMLSVKPGTIRRISGLTDFREGLFLNYRAGLYHLTYSIDDTGSENYRVGYATSTSVSGPWTSRGVILSKDLSQGIRGTGHHSIVQVPGTDEWYVAYHRLAIPGGDGTHRETTIDRLVFDASGYMSKVVPTLESIAPVGDTTAPRLDLTVPTAPASGWFTAAVTVQAAASDRGSGLAALEHRLDGGPWVAASDPATLRLTVSTEGRHVLEVRATDVAGNSAAPARFSFAIDASPPASSATVNASRELVVQATDAVSGVARIEYRRGSDAWTSYGGAVPLGSAAATVEVRAVDHAGNVEPARTLAVPQAPPVPAVPVATRTAAMVSPVSVAFGAKAVVKVRVSGAGGVPSGAVRVLEGSRLVASASLADGGASIVLPRSLTVGAHALTVSYGGDARFAASSVTAHVSVVKAASKVSVKVSPKKVTSSRKATVVVGVKSAGAVAGKVTVKVTSKVKGKVRTVVVKKVAVSAKGAASVVLPKLKKGTYTVSVSYAGSSSVKAATGTATVTVRR